MSQLHSSEPNVVMLAAEAVPFAKVGGLADVAGALPRALEKCGVKTTLIIPGHRAALSGLFDTRPCGAVGGFDVRMGPSIESAEIHQTRMNGTDVYLIGSRTYFDREGIYDDPSTGEGYPDNMLRFIFFMKAALELLERLGQPFDILHCHDSHTALVPGLLDMNHRHKPFFSRTGTLFTIHNLAYQGLYSKDALDYAEIDQRHFYPMSPFEYWGQVNSMKAGIELSDKVNTVSRTYSVEIRSGAEFGMGLEGVLRDREDDLTGIVNGIDYGEWDPSRDPLIPAHYSVRNLAGKAACKNHLLKQVGLPRLRRRVPLVGMVSRLSDQKGFDLILEAADEITALDLQLVILGTGQKKYHEFLEDLAARHPRKVAAKLTFSNQLAHRIEAGCDIFLMPSRFEPCGLNQLYSLRYGTIPVVRKTGGLADTVIPWESGKATGFSFSGYSAAEMMVALRQALALYSNRNAWQEMMKRAMTQDWSWDRSATDYLELYRAIRDRRLGAR